MRGATAKEQRKRPINYCAVCVDDGVTGVQIHCALFTQLIARRRQRRQTQPSDECGRANTEYVGYKCQAHTVWLTGALHTVDSETARSRQLNQNSVAIGIDHAYSSPIKGLLFCYSLEARTIESPESIGGRYRHQYYSPVNVTLK